MKLFRITTLAIFLCASAPTLNIYADEEQDQLTETTIPVIQEDESQHYSLNARELDDEQRFKIEKDKEMRLNKFLAAFELNLEDDEEEPALAAEEEVVEKGSGTYTSSYPYTAHYVTGTTAYCESAELEDGSLWYIDPAYRHRIDGNWFTTDPVVIIPYSSWFSTYAYQIVNLNTSVSVPVKLRMGPYYEGKDTRWIAALDRNTREVWLNDGSYWVMSSLDYSVFAQWMINDTIIVGMNTDSFASSYPNILINVNLHKFDVNAKYENYVRAAYYY